MQTQPRIGGVGELKRGIENVEYAAACRSCSMASAPIAPALVQPPAAGHPGTFESRMIA
jgi:hypothetical protein